MRSSHPLTATCVERRDAGHSGATIARVVGRSETWVSRHLAAWDGAGRELHHAWEEGRLTDDAVMRIAALPKDRQAAAIANPPRSRRGAAARPQVEEVRRVAAEIDKGLAQGRQGEALYRQGAAEALRWALGAGPAPRFLRAAKL